MESRSNEVPKHTPGPWGSEKIHPGGEWLVYKAMNLPVAKVLHAEDSALIAAAPEMLAALDAIEIALDMGYHPAEVLQEGGAIRNAIKAAIAKAEGRQA